MVSFFLFSETPPRLKLRPDVCHKTNDLKDHAHLEVVLASNSRIVNFLCSPLQCHNRIADLELDCTDIDVQFLYIECVKKIVLLLVWECIGCSQLCDRAHAR
jgi:hypothetical protein